MMAISLPEESILNIAPKRPTFSELVFVLHEVGECTENEWNGTRRVCESARENISVRRLEKK